MAEKIIIPFGPQHPVLPEPIHFDLVVDQEMVVDATPLLGFIHRGLENLVEKLDYTEFVYVAERVCGICSFQHGMAFCEAVEEVMDVQVPIRGKFLRTAWAELSRIQSHILWLGLIADAMGFESLFMHTWRIREAVLEIFEETTGGRVIFGVNKVGGVKRDISKETIDWILKKLKKVETEIKELTHVFIQDFTVQHRLIGLGVLSKDEAYKLGTVGPMAKASGINYDLRMTGYEAYSYLDFEPIVETSGDCYARCVVRIRETYQSIDLVRQAFEKMPEGEIEVKVTGSPDGEFFNRVEQPRGEAVYYVKGNGTKKLQRFRLRTPTFANVPSMVKLLKGNGIVDVPIIILTIDPCISCNER